MKGVATWIMVAGGIMIGLVVITLSLTLASNIFKGQQQSLALSQYADLANRIESICTASNGNVDFMRIRIPEITRAIYPSVSKQAPPDSVSDMITQGSMGSGNSVCIQFFNDPDPRCTRLDCPMDMTYVGSPSLKDDLFSLVSKLGGTYPIYEYFMTIEKANDRVKVTGQKVISEKPVFCTVNTLPTVDIIGTCADKQGQAKPLLIFSGSGSVAVFGDVSSWTSDNKDFAALLGKIGQKFAGKALIIWESDNGVSTGQLNGKVVQHIAPGTDPSTKPNIKQAFESLGGSVSSDSFKRTQKITPDLLSQYKQVWLVRPGFCNAYQRNSQSGKIAAGCKDIQAFDASEVNALVSFVTSGGKLLIITNIITKNNKGVVDTSQMDIVNSILRGIGTEFVVSQQLTCEGSSYTTKSSTLGTDPLSIPIAYAATFDCK